MKKKSYWLSISVFVLILIWTVYYYAMQYTGGFADLKDSIVCEYGFYNQGAMRSTNSS